MSLSLIATFVWLLLANVLAMLPSKDNHWFRAYVLIALGLPLLVWVWWENGNLIALLALAGGMSVLRWPVRYLLAWVGRVTRLARSGKPD
jgi:ABC-type transporter Mla subunit MlaD